MAGRVLIEECSKESQGKIKGLSHECRNCLCNKKIGFHPSLKLKITWDKQCLQNFVYKSPLSITACKLICVVIWYIIRLMQHIQNALPGSLTQSNLTYRNLINEQHLISTPLLYPLSRAADSNATGEDGFDEKGCHCDISVEDLLPSVKSVIRAVRWGKGDGTNSIQLIMHFVYCHCCIRTNPDRSPLPSANSPYGPCSGGYSDWKISFFLY